MRQLSRRPRLPRRPGVPRLAHVALLAGAAVVLLAPDTAHAQLGGLRRRMEERMAKAVLGEDSKSSATPTFNDRVLEISDARLGQLIKGLRVEAAEAERSEREMQAMDAREAEHAKAAEAYGKCSEPYAKEMLKLTGMTMGLGLAAKREESKNGKISPATQDSLNAVTSRMLKMKDAMVARCGEGPGDSPFGAMQEAAEGPDAEETGAKAAGLTRDQYAVLRERVAAWLQSRDGRTGPYAFTAGERAALERRAGDLAPFRALLVD